MIDIRLEDLMPTPFNYRRHFIGGSDARIIMAPDEDALLRLWREKRGEVKPPDFSDNLVVQLGVATEPLNRAWYERNTGKGPSPTSIGGFATRSFAGWRPPWTEGSMGRG